MKSRGIDHETSSGHRGASRMRALLVLVSGSFAFGCGGGKPPPATDPKPPTSGTAETGSGSAAPAVEEKPKPPVSVDFASLTCKNIETSPPPGVCGVLEKAPRADAAKVGSAIAVWKRLEGPFAALSGRESALAVLAPEARTSDGPDGTPIPPAAYICPGAPPTVYVPATLLALVDGKDPKKFPEDFLAFVLGHELGHRMNDLTPDGCQLAAFQRPGKGAWEEELADARSAFFITQAGFSASKVARDDMVSRFLEAEYEMRKEDTKTRKDALLGALQKFDSYEALYQAALTVALTGEMEAADRLLTWADELVQSHGVPLPEIRVMRAIARINRAAEMAPWNAELTLPVGIDQLRCAAVHPGHSGLYEEPDKRVRGPDIERGRKLLKEALALLVEAEARGATPLTIASARACANLYLADATAANEAQARAESLSSANATVKQALADNRALVTFLEFARKKQAPTVDEADALATWTDELEATLGPAAKTHSGLAFVLANLRNPRAKPDATNMAGCASAKKDKKPTFAAVPPPGAHGACPAGYKLAHALPTLEAAAKTGSKQGITTCTGDKGGELVTIRLAATTEPPLGKLERTLITAAPPAGLETFGAWKCACETIERQGVSDSGEVAYLAACAGLKLETGAVLRVVDDKVVSVTQYSR